MIDVLAMKALIYADASGKPKEEELSDEQKERAETARTRLCEAVAETDDALLEKYLDKGVLEDAEVAHRTARGHRCRQADAGTVRLGRQEYRHRAAARRDRHAAARRPTNGRRAWASAAPTASRSSARPIRRRRFRRFVFKTVIDPFAGKLSIFRVVSGRAASDATVLNSTRGVRERFGQLLRLEGKKQSPIATALPGEIVAVAKLKDTTTGDTLCDEKSPIIFPAAERPAPVISFAIRPKTKGDEQKASQALQHLVEEDRALETHRDPQTHDIILSGTGQMHIEVTVEKLKRKFNVEVELQAPKVPYKETIKGRAEAQGKYKRQSGGRGQYGDCWLKVEPLPRGGGFEFKDEIVGGAIPRQFIPSVEKGVRNTLVEGHPGRLSRGRRQGRRSSTAAITTSIRPTWRSRLRPRWGSRRRSKKPGRSCWNRSMALEVSCPDECMGDVIGDLNSRRGKVLGMDRKGHEPGDQGAGADVRDSEVCA